MVLCDLQGAIYRDGVVLTDPVILSRNESYGVTDLGARGISTFFGRHVCNQFCEESWQIPNDQTRHFRAVKGTTMVARRIPSHRARDYMTGYY